MGLFDEVWFEDYPLLCQNCDELFPDNTPWVTKSLLNLHLPYFFKADGYLYLEDKKLSNLHCWVTVTEPCLKCHFINKYHFQFTNGFFSDIKYSDEFSPIEMLGGGLTDEEKAKISSG